MIEISRVDVVGDQRVPGTDQERQRFLQGKDVRLGMLGDWIAIVPLRETGNDGKALDGILVPRERVQRVFASRASLMAALDAQEEDETAPEAAASHKKR